MIAYNDAFMGDGKELRSSGTPGFGASNRTPATSRVEKVRAKSGREAAPKGLARPTVSVKWLNGRVAEVRVKGSLHILGHLRSAQGKKGKSYSYKLLHEQRSHAGFSTQKAAIARMLEKS